MKRPLPTTRDVFGWYGVLERAQRVCCAVAATAISCEPTPPPSPSGQRTRNTAIYRTVDADAQAIMCARSSGICSGQTH
jgi:hypothetical protein